MATSTLRIINSNLNRFGIYRSNKLVTRCFCSIAEQTITNHSGEKTSDFPSPISNQITPPTTTKTETFASLLRNSKFIDLGLPEGKRVVGTIYHVFEDDVYIDFGWKFHAVCKKPKKNQNLYIVGAQVKLLVKDLELSTRFLGGTTDITLCEADCVLLGLLKRTHE